MRKIAAIVSLLLLVCVASAQTPVCGTNVLYFQHNLSTSPAGYEELINYPSGNTEQDENITIKNTDGPVLIDAYIMPEGSLASATELLRGLREFDTYHYVDTASGVTRINYTAFRRFPNGTEHVFYSQTTEDINALTTTAYTTYRVSQDDLKLSHTDRLGIKIYGQTTHAANVKLHFVYQGMGNASHFHSGFFECPTPPVNDQSSYAPAALLFSLVGGLIGALVVVKKGGFK